MLARTSSNTPPVVDIVLRHPQKIQCRFSAALPPSLVRYGGGGAAPELHALGRAEAGLCGPALKLLPPTVKTRVIGVSINRKVILVSVSEG